MSLKRFRQFTSLDAEQSDLQESSFLNKGFALTQAARHKSAAQKLLTSARKIDTLAQRAKSSENNETKLDLISDALSELAKALEHQTAMSSSTINVSVAATVLNSNVKDVVDKALSKTRSKRR